VAGRRASSASTAGRGRSGAEANRDRSGGALGTGSGPERLQKTLARVGYGSRRAAEELIREGRVTVAGREATLGDRVDPARDQVAVDGVPIPVDPELRYLALNKPRGVTATMRDPHAERTIAALLPSGPRVFPVGRLDRESEGLLLLTNDGELAHRIQHPRHGIDKEYLVEVDGAFGGDALRRLRSGVELDDGVAHPARIGRVLRARGRASVPVVMVEGRKRVVRRMFAALGHPVRRLVRVRVGPVRLGGLGPGEIRPLEAREVQELYRVTGLGRARTGRGPRRQRQR
jgi:23S rRNA pseudouridine2605 synthase